jgi:hypothetical protein
MNGTTMRVRGARPLRYLCAVFSALLLFSACESPSGESNAPLLQALAVPAELDVVYGPVNHDNPFEHVGMRHNDAVHSVVLAAQPWDTLSIPTMYSRIQKAIPSWAASAMDVPSEMGTAHVKTAFAMKIDSSARLQLASFDRPGYSAREIRYLRAIGSLLCEARSFPELEKGINDIERAVLSESWPEGNRTEIAARVAISVTKHSLAYWKHVFRTAAGIPESDLATAPTLRKQTELLIKLLGKCEIVVGADAMAATSAGEAAAGMGFLAQLQAAIISGGAVSTIVAVLVYWEDIVGFFREICPWKSTI